MNQDIVTTETLEGEFIAAGEAEHKFTAEPISESMSDRLKQQGGDPFNMYGDLSGACKPGAGAEAFAEAQRRQAEAMRNIGMSGLQGAGLGGFGGIAQSAAAGLFGFK